MGEIAEAIVEGLLCQTCGEFLGGDVPGHPRYCHTCQPKPTEAVRRVAELMDELRKTIGEVS